MDIHFSKSLNKRLKNKNKFKPPTNSEIKEYLQQTGGVVDNELLIFLNLKSHPDREIFWYNGKLSVQQRAHIYQSLNKGKDG